MVYCPHCGQGNVQTSNFCRFCGTRIAAEPAVLSQAFHKNVSSGGGSFEFDPPRPYSWKTDEFKVAPTKTAPKPAPATGIRQVQPLAGFAAPPVQNYGALEYRPAPAAVYGYRCPRCSTQTLPHVTKQISTGGWIVFAVLLVTFFPLFWIGFLIKDEVRTCSVCNLKLD